MEETQEVCLPKKKRKKAGRGGRPRASDRAVINGIWYVLFGPAASGRRFIGIGSGSPRALSTSVFREMDEDGHLREADEKDGPVLRKGARWGRLEVASDGFQELRSAPLGGEKTGKNPTDRGKLGAKINLIIDERGAPISITLTGANRHDKMSAIDL